MKSKEARRKLLILCVLCLAMGAFLFTTYLVSIYNINQFYYLSYCNTHGSVELRKFPYPFKAAMTICSDIDNTETLEEFLEIQKFLNTTEITSMGRGVGLEIGNSFLMYAPPTCCISYFSQNLHISKILIRFIKSGYIDVLHSYGEKNEFSRADALTALKALEKKGCKLDVWVDHSKTVDNLGDDVTFGLGDHPDSMAYHSDLTLGYGIRFVWLGRVTMITGQSVPIAVGTFTSIFDPQYPFHSLVNISKEFTKNFLAIFGSKKYAMHKNNELVKITTLDDGRKVYEFIRFDNYWKGVGTGANAKRLAYVISKKTLNRIKEVGGYMIVYTHLGMNCDCSQFMPRETQNALRVLADEYKAGNIYVTSTSKLLNYYINHKYLNWSYESKGREIIISIYNVQDPIFGSFVPTVQDLKGITFYIPNESEVKIYINDKEIEDIRRNPPDHSKRESLTISPR